MVCIFWRMSQVKTPRDYQEQAINALFNGLFTREGNPLLVAPVGAGKSLICAEIIKRLHGWYPGLKIIVLTHVKELLVQNQQELYKQYPSCDFGFYCAGLNQKKLHNDVTFASIQSIGKKADIMPRVPSIIIVDEAHLIPHKSETQYRIFIDDCLKLNPKMKVIGLTGTPFRSDSGRLDEGENKLFDYVAHEIPMSYMIEEGWWAKPVSPKTAYQMDTTGVDMRAGDFIESQLQEAVNKPEITDVCIKELMEIGKGRKRWLVFTAGIRHAEDVTTALNEAGISAKCIHSESDECSMKIINEHKNGEFKALVNVAKLTVGYNDPNIDLLAIFRPMRSPVLYVQVVGRGVRPVYADGYDMLTSHGRLDAIANGTKPDILIADFGGVVEELGPVDQIDIRKKYSGEKDKDGNEGGSGATFKICPNCGTECASSQNYCYNCSHCFINLESKAYNSAIVSMDAEPEWINVYDVHYDVHKKIGSYPSMKVSYYTLSGIIREWVCVEHHNYEVGDNKRYAWNQAVKWHKKRSDEPCPTSVDDAVNFGYKNPTRIMAKKDGKYWRVMDYEFDYSQEENEGVDEVEEYFEIPF